MATSSSSTMTMTMSLVLLLSATVVAVAGGAPAGVEEKLKAACDGTPHPETCLAVLSPSADGGNTASACALAILAAGRANDVVGEAYKRIDAVSREIADDDRDLAERDLPEYWPCLDTCLEKLGDGYTTYIIDPRAMMEHLRSFVTDAKEKHVVWNCDACRSLGNKKVEEVAKGSKLEKFMEVFYALVARVPGAGLDCS